jgi:hypothetical protein
VLYPKVAGIRRDEGDSVTCDPAFTGIIALSREGAAISERVERFDALLVAFLRGLLRPA